MASFVTIIILELLLFFFPFTSSLKQLQTKLVQPPLIPNSCNETCGKHHVPFPFYLNNTSCVSSSFSTSFHLTCTNSSTLFIKLASQNYPILDFFSDGLLVDFPGASSCRQYNDLNSFGERFFDGKNYFGVSVDNIVGLYDCEDSSLCKADCETVNLPGCDGSVGGGSLGCCYPLSDHSVWHVGEGFSVFSKFGCRGFSSWAVLRGDYSGKRGVKLEFAIPRNFSEVICAKNADVVNSTSVKDGVRCVCQDAYVGDAFANGTGCILSCIKDGKEAYGSDCYIKRHDQRKMVIMAGILCPVLIVASLATLFYLLKRKEKPGMFDSEQAYYHNISFRKACRTRLFSHHELEDATNGFEENRKFMQCNNSTMFAGVLGDGSHVAIHKLSKCENEKDMIQVMSQIEVLSSILHRNIALILGCCVDSNYAPLVIYEYPANGTLEDHLHQKFQNKGQKLGLDWYRRLNIATEIASTIALLHYDKSPPIFHHNLKSSCIFLDDDFSVKVAGFGLVNHDYTKCQNHVCKNDVYDIGVMLLEIIYGSNQLDTPKLALKKIRDGKIEEIVDPVLDYHEQPHCCQEQIQIMADLATRCLLFGADGKMGMVDVARELVHLSKESVDGGNVKGLVLEETFSNSSLLQMISMSPDSMNVP
ncbi:unnamed protein product [Vicia faba]|uniref:Protein kinase domain-containing protein n=1 Tax=Vicia faba TaxID=3906 RepID=A0AAV1AE04_VICFA|nr:unnamed protein product [Vicia faba]